MKDYFGIFMIDPQFLSQAKKVIVPLCEQNNVLFKTPILLVVMGLIGAGKSTLSCRIAQAYPFYYASADNVRVALCPNPNHCRIETSQTYATLYEVTEELLVQGKSVLIDATMPKAIHRDELVKRFGKLATLVLVYVDVSLREIRERIGKRQDDFSNPLQIKFYLNTDYLERVIQELEPPSIDEFPHVFFVKTTQIEKGQPLLQFLESCLS